MDVPIQNGECGSDTYVSTCVFSQHFERYKLYAISVLRPRLNSQGSFADIKDLTLRKDIGLAFLFFWSDIHPIKGHRQSVDISCDRIFCILHTTYPN